MKKLILMIVLLLGAYIYLDTYFDRNNPPPLCLLSESELSTKMYESTKDVDNGDQYIRMGLDMGNSMVAGMHRKGCADRPLWKRIPERLAYELKKLQKKF